MGTDQKGSDVFYGQSAQEGRIRSLCKCQRTMVSTIVSKCCDMDFASPSMFETAPKVRLPFRASFGQLSKHHSTKGHVSFPSRGHIKGFLEFDPLACILLGCMETKTPLVDPKRTGGSGSAQPTNQSRAIMPAFPKPFDTFSESQSRNNGCIFEHMCPFWLVCLKNRGPWFRWGLFRLPGPSICPKATSVFEGFYYMWARSNNLGGDDCGKSD